MKDPYYHTRNKCTYFEAFPCIRMSNLLTDIMQCGPAPLTAVKEGDVHLGYDTGFIFAEVQGSKANWRFDDTDGSVTSLSVDRFAVGKVITTNPMTGNRACIITDGYKYADGMSISLCVQKWCQIDVFLAVSIMPHTKWNIIIANWRTCKNYLQLQTSINKHHIWWQVVEFNLLIFCISFTSMVATVWKK